MHLDSNVSYSLFDYVLHHVNQVGIKVTLSHSFKQFGLGRNNHKYKLKLKISVLIVFVPFVFPDFSHTESYLRLKNKTHFVEAVGIIWLKDFYWDLLLSIVKKMLFLVGRSFYFMFTCTFYWCISIIPWRKELY